MERRRFVKQLTLVVLVVLSGCGPTTFVDFCKQSAARSCKCFFQCAGSSAMALYADEAACTEDVTTKAKCGELFDLPCDVDASKANACLSEIDGASCTNPAQAFASGACQDPSLCKLRPGVIQCRSNESNTTNNGRIQVCTYTRGTCTDGKTYTVRCTGSACACATDAAPGPTFEDAGFCKKTSQDRAALLKSLCMVNVF